MDEPDGVPGPCRVGAPEILAVRRVLEREPIVEHARRIVVRVLEPDRVMRDPVDDEVEIDLDARVVGRFDKVDELGLGPESRVDPVRRTVLIPVVRRAREDRVHPHRRDPQILQIPQPLAHALEVPEAVGVGGVRIRAVAPRDGHEVVEHSSALGWVANGLPCPPPNARGVIPMTPRRIPTHTVFPRPWNKCFTVHPSRCIDDRCVRTIADRFGLNQRSDAIVAGGLYGTSDGSASS